MIMEKVLDERERPNRSQMISVIEDAAIEIGKAAVDQETPVLTEVAWLLYSIHLCYHGDSYGHIPESILEHAFSVAVAWGIGVAEYGEGDSK